MNDVRQPDSAGPRVLIVDDSANDQATLVEMLGRLGLEASPVGTLSAARDALAGTRFDLVFLDVHLPDGDGSELLRSLDGRHGPDVVFVTGDPSVDSAVEALRGGANDYLTKPIDAKRLEKIANAVLRTAELRGEMRELRRELRRAGRFCSMVGTSDRMQTVYDLIEQVAPTDTTVMIFGETGTGKELAANAVHALSRRAKRPFVPLNTGAVSSTLIESELFGHEKGSFTGADRLHRGVFERAHGGTLFLDELPEMPVELQVKLLRVLESQRLMRLGGDRPIDIDVRLIVASNRDPHDAVKQGKLREDLLYRLLVFPIELPPLRDRGGDIELLARHFLEQMNEAAGETKQLSDKTMAVLRSAPWPGNVRELMHTIERAFIVAKDRLTVDTLPATLRAERSSAGTTSDGLGIEIGHSIAEAERRLILATVESVNGNKKLAAKILGVSVKTLYNRLREYRSSSAS